MAKITEPDEAPVATGRRPMGWLREGLLRSRWPAVAACAYLTLWSVDLVRVMGSDRTAVLETGLYSWEEGPPREAGEESAEFRWTGETARVVTRPAGAVLTIPLYAARPDISSRPVHVSLAIDERPLDRVRLDVNGWHEFIYYLPALAETPTDAPVTIGIAADSTFVPSAHSNAPDDRRLGIGIGRLSWSDEPAGDGLGFYGWEDAGPEEPTRWTRRRASMLVPVEGSTAILELLATHPDIDRLPVGVVISWNAVELTTVQLSESRWQPIRVQLPTDVWERGVITLVISRTWNPATAQGSHDSRDLGVMMRPIRWER